MLTDPEPVGSGATVTLTMSGVLSGIKALGLIAVFVIPYGMAFGATSSEVGFSFSQSTFMSMSIFAGAAQFASLDFLTAPTLSISLCLTVLAVNARHAVLSAVLAPWINQLSRPKRYAALFFMSDPNFAECNQAFKHGTADIGRLIGGGLALWLARVLGTGLGWMIGARFGNLDRFGIDVLMAAFFTALVVGKWEGRSSLFPAVVAAGVAVAGLYVLPTGWNIVAAAIAGGVVGWLAYER